MIVAIVGIGLIGGSIGISIKENGFAEKVIGVEANEANANRALQLGLIDELQPLAIAIQKAELIILATPVDTVIKLLPDILTKLTPKQVVMEVGSTKQNIMEAIKHHPNRGNFIATHPMAGTEFSGPDAAVLYLFDGKVAVFCDIANSSKRAINIATKLYKSLRMRIVQLEANDHDVHVAYISHISHLCSFALAITVLEKEKNEDRIFDLASTGFSSTVRLAKSSPDTWVPIFRQNRENVLDVLDEYLKVVQKMRDILAEGEYEKLHQMIAQSNVIKKVLKQ
jgi:prephenate dehydrogenase